MGQCIIMTGGYAGDDSDDCTAVKSQVLSGYKAITKDSDDDAVMGTMPERGAWTGSVGMNGSVIIPGGHHDGSGKVNGPAITQRGAWNGSVGMNSQIAVTEGYHNGSGKVSGPSITYQNVDISGTDRARATNTSAWGGVICLGVRNGYYLNGVNWIQADIAGLQAGNIREGINIGGLTGTLKDLSVNHVPFDGASFSGVLVKGAELCNWYNNTILREPVEISGDGIRLRYSRVYQQYNKFCPKESITFSAFKKIRVTVKFTGSSAGKGHATVTAYRANTSRSDILLNSTTGILKNTTISMDYSGTLYTGELDISAVNDEGFLTIHFVNAEDRNYTSYFICRIEFLI